MRAAIASHVDGGHVVRPAGVAGRPLEHLHARPTRRRPESPTARTRSAVSRPSASQPAQYSRRIGWRLAWIEKRLLARQRALHRPAEQPRGQRGLGLVGHVLLAAERAAVGHQLDGDPIGVDAEHRGDVVAVVPHALPAGVHVQARRRRRGHGERRLGLEEGVLDALGLEHLVHDVGAARRARRRRRRGRTSLRDSTLSSVPHTAISGSSIAATGSVTGASTS